MTTAHSAASLELLSSVASADAAAVKDTMSRVSIETIATTAATSSFMADDDVEDDDDNEHYWNKKGWVPRTKQGTPKKPSQIRLALQNYLNTCGETQTAVLRRMFVKPNSFQKFMNPKYYKNEWSATANDTYWAAARLLEEEAFYKKKAKEGEKKNTKKRKAAAALDDGGDEVASTAAPAANLSPPPPSKKQSKESFVQLCRDIAAVSLAAPVPTSELSADVPKHVRIIYEMDRSEGKTIIFDSCPELVKKINTMLQLPGASKSELCKHLGVQSVQLNKFLVAREQDAAGQAIYGKAYEFFEKKRLLEQAPKSAARLKNEQELAPRGFAQGGGGNNINKWIMPPTF